MLGWAVTDVGLGDGRMPYVFTLIPCYWPFDLVQCYPR